MSWGKIKVSQADRLFSEYIRKRDGGKCRRCMMPLGYKRLQNSHFFGRRYRSVRFEPDNCDAMCPTCHRVMGENPNSFNEWKKRQLGEKKFNRLIVRAHKGRPVKKHDEKLIVTWCKDQLKKLEGKYI